MAKEMQNLNTGYYQTLDENFNQALNLFEKNLSQNELISMLEEGNIVQKQIAALKLSHIENSNQAKNACILYVCLS